MLTERQKRFVDAYAGNGLEAARSAGYAGSDATLKVTASKLLKHPAVRDAIEERQAHPPDTSPEGPRLAPKHQAFVDAYLRLGDAAKAARAIGVAASSARKMLRRADVHEALELDRARREAADIVQARETQVLLSAIARDSGVDAKDRIRALDVLHKIQRGMLPAAARGEATSSEPKRPHLVIVRNGRGPSDG